MALHTDKYSLSPDEMSKLWCDLREETSLVTIGDEVVGGQSGFAHIAGAFSLILCLCWCSPLILALCRRLLGRSSSLPSPSAPLWPELTRPSSLQYYGYLWSQVFSADMYETVFSKDPMSKEGGQRYRKEILQPGGSRYVACVPCSVTRANEIAHSDEMDSLVKFLGRKPTNDAFLKSLLG